ncbi:unnamed protein product [Amoebophrya sp. A25]|nr:unnamed protein product [Amoebophrya sp. A25]|eukprot:GSA25T00011304001.1
MQSSPSCLISHLVKEDDTETPSFDHEAVMLPVAMVDVLKTKTEEQYIKAP